MTGLIIFKDGGYCVLDFSCHIVSLKLIGCVLTTIKICVGERKGRHALPGRTRLFVKL